MNVLFTSYKGGVGKSSLAYNFAIYTCKRYLTNDIISIDDVAIIQIEPKKRSIPAQHRYETDTVFDFGAMSTQLDPKINQAVQLAHVVVIPTLTDPRSLQATVDTAKLVADKGKPIAVIINNFTDQRKFEMAKQYLIDRLGPLPIYAIRATTLFERVSRDGKAWLQNIHSHHGEHQLQKTQAGHENVYDAILALGAKR